MTSWSGWFHSRSILKLSSVEILGLTHCHEEHKTAKCANRDIWMYLCHSITEHASQLFPSYHLIVLTDYTVHKMILSGESQPHLSNFGFQLCAHYNPILENEEIKQNHCLQLNRLWYIEIKECAPKKETMGLLKKLNSKQPIIHIINCIASLLLVI